MEPTRSKESGGAPKLIVEPVFGAFRPGLLLHDQLGCGTARRVRRRQVMPNAWILR
jgi:hypothetical protein